MAKLAIKGHSTRGNEVIKILEMLGGKNETHIKATVLNAFYYINEDGKMYLADKYSDMSNFVIYTLEEFLEKYPYKVGDTVIAYAEGCIAQFTIQDMRWNYELNKVEYKICSSWCDTSLMQPYKEETMDKVSKTVFDANAQCCDITNNLIKNETMKEIKLDIPDGYKFFGVDNDNQQVVFTKIQPQYPKTYEECCDVLGIEEDLWFVYEDIDGNHINPACISNYRMRRLDLYHNLEKLLICRDAYWKISGDWKPVFTDYENKFVITNCYDNIYPDFVKHYNRVLVFPTEEMRDAFYENFKDLIEECKELL